jgi:pyrroloquinoline quinone biosynthesis protein B
MLIKVLGSAAGGGLPQINCRCSNCADVRLGKPGLTPRTQSSVAVSGDGAAWALLNASPDLRQQVAATPALSPPARERSHERSHGCQGGPRASPIKAVVLTNGDVDHVAGLLSLREGFAFTVYATERVLSTLAANSIFDVLDRRLVQRVPLPLGRPTMLAGGGVDLGLAVEAFPVPGKVALYLEDATAGTGFGTREGDTIGVRVTNPATGAAFFYIPGCAAVDAALAERLTDASLVFFDGTLFTDGEMIAQGLSGKTGQRMGHVSMSGPEGSLAAFRALGVKRRIFVHINNSNPVLRQDSPERAEVERAGWEVAFDGMEVRA